MIVLYKHTDLVGKCRIVLSEKDRLYVTAKVLLAEAAAKRRSLDLPGGSLRLSINEENNEEEIDQIIEVVTDSVAKLRKSSPMWHDRLSGRKGYYL